MLLKVIGVDSQWADTIKIALGVAIPCAIALNCDVQIGSSSIIGAPWPIYRAGIVEDMVLLYSNVVETSTKVGK